MPTFRQLLYAFSVGAIGVGIVLFRSYDFEPQEYELPLPPTLQGPLATNTLLRNAKLLLKSQISGPESLLVEKDAIYTGTWDGKILMIVNGVIEKEIRLVPSSQQTECGTYDTEPKCGRPLGIRRLNSELLVVADAYLGIYTVDFNKGTFKRILSTDKPIDGHRLAFVNDLDVLDENTVFLTDSSSRWDRRRFLHDFMEHKPSGRVLRLNIATGKAEVVLKGLYFANGIQILNDRTSFIVSECSMARIVRFHFDGPKKGQREVFIENLPGLPDNIRRSVKGTYYVGLAAVRHDAEFSLLDRLSSLPTLRKYLIQLVPDRYLGTIFSLVGKKYGFVVEFDESGRIVKSYQDPTGTVVPDVSQASDDETHLYLGSFHSDFIAKVPKKG